MVRGLVPSLVSLGRRENESIRSLYRDGSRDERRLVSLPRLLLQSLSCRGANCEYARQLNDEHRLPLPARRGYGLNVPLSSATSRSAGRGGPAVYGQNNWSPSAGSAWPVPVFPRRKMPSRL